MAELSDDVTEQERPKRVGGPHLPQASKLGVEARARKAAVFAANLLPIVRRIQAADPGCGYQWIVDRLNERGVASPRGGPWSVSSLHAIVKRELGGLDS